MIGVPNKEIVDSAYGMNYLPPRDDEERYDSNEYESESEPELDSFGNFVKNLKIPDEE